MRSGGSVLALLIALAVITFLDRISIAVAGARIQDELHIAPERWGWILGAFVLAYGLFEIPSGALGDRSGYKRVLSRIVLWWSAFTCLTGLATGFTTLLATRFLFGAGEAGAYPNIAGVIAQWFPKEQRASKQGFIWSASRLGGALSPLIVVPLQQRLGWRVTFAILGAVGVIWVVCWKLMYSEVQRLAPKVTEPIPWRVLSSARMRLIIAMYFCQAFGSWFYFAWFPVYLVKGAGFSESQMGIFSALPFVLGATGSLIGGVLSDRFGRSLIGSAGLAASSLLLVSMTLVTNQAAIVVLSSLGFGAADLMLPAAWAICMDVSGPHAGAATGAMNTAGQLGGFVCTVLFGYVVRATGNYQAPVWIVAALVMAGALLFTRLKESPR